MVAAGVAVAVVVPMATAGATSSGDWTTGGQGVTNWHSQPNESVLNQGTVKKATPKWIATMAGDVSATPAVVGNDLYVPDWGGKFSNLDATTGAVKWTLDVGAAVGVPGAKSRTSPAIDGNNVIFGTQAGAYLVAVNRTTGALVWKTKLDSHPLAVDSQSPIVYNGTIYVGVASLEEGAAANPSYPCCTFRGSAMALDAATGAVKWKTYTTVPNGGVPGGYSGAAVWGSTPAIDAKRGSVYYTTGNNYDVPQSVKDCEAARDPLTPDTCDDPANYVDAMMSLDLNTGAINWARKLQGYDAWTVACFATTTGNCPFPAGPDYDFGQGAMLIPTKSGDIVAAGQKSGVMWGLDAGTGAVKWGTFGGPGSSLGGMEWGSATDGTNIYYSIANIYGIPYTLTNPPAGTPTSTTAGLWGAIDAATGKIKWQTADPNGAEDLGGLSTAKGVVYAGSMGRALFEAPGTSATRPTFFALDASNGKQLWSYVSGGSVNASPAISNGTAFWGSGYTNLGLGDGNAKLFAFSK